jgi:apolipoprotein N-acyltransferase
MDSDTLLLTGVLAANSKENQNRIQYYNGLMSWKPNTAPKRVYDKSHLVPFGEYIPFQRFIPLRPVVAFSGFEKGNGPETIKIDDFPSFTPKICYEIIFPRQMIARNQPRPDYILTVTNDAWYGDSPGPYQHFTQARFRAIENKLPVIRSANTGISGIIDPYGRVVQQTNLMEEAVVSSELPL